MKAFRQHMIETRWFFVCFPVEAKAGSRWVSEMHVRLHTTIGQQNEQHDALHGEAQWGEKRWTVEIRKSRKGIASAPPGS
jgi:hypothetical protein